MSFQNIGLYYCLMFGAGASVDGDCAPLSWTGPGTANINLSEPITWVGPDAANVNLCGPLQE